MGESVVEDVALTALRSFTRALSSRVLSPALRDAEVAAAVDSPASMDRLARIAAMEDLRAVLAAAQAVEVAALVSERRAAIEVDIATMRRPGIGRSRRRELSHRQTIAQIALARRVSPYQARQFVAFAEQAPADLPSTFQLLATGRLSERRAAIVHGVTRVLESEQRRQVDTLLAPDLPALADAEVDQRARRAVYELDPAGTVQRHALAHADRRVSVRPAPEGMAWATVLCAMPDAVGIRAGLERDAAALLAAGDPRSRGQVMSDLAVERITGRDPGQPQPVAIQLVMTDRTLAGTSDTPARFAVGDPWPAPLARAWTLGADSEGDTTDPAAVSVRRLFTDPAGRLVTLETKAREFTAGQADLIRLRDGICTTPWCNAPIRHIDHHDPHAHGGPTAVDNGEGKCVWCNQTKADTPPDPRPPCAPARPPRSTLEQRFRRRIRRATRENRRAAGGRERVRVPRGDQPRPHADLVVTAVVLPGPVTCHRGGSAGSSPSTR